MVKVSKGAGLVYLCNPNNPSGTVHGPETIDATVRAILKESPDTYIHLDEAYIDYGDPAKIQTGLALTQEFKNVFITRSFSKAHALAGMRIGYAMGHRDTLNAIRNSWGMGDVSMLGAIAALTAFEDREHIEWEREENNRVKAFTVGALNDLGYDVPNPIPTICSLTCAHLLADSARPAWNAKSLWAGISHPGKTRTAVFLWAAWKRWKLRSESSVRCLARVAGINGIATVGLWCPQSQTHALTLSPA